MAALQTLALSPDGRSLAVAHRALFVVDLAAGTREVLLDRQVTSLSFARGLLAAGERGGPARVWRGADLVLEVPGRGDRGVGLTHDTLIVSDGESLEHWDLATRSRARVLPGPARGIERLVLSPDGTRMAVASKQWELLDRAGTPINGLSGMPLDTDAVAFSPTGELALSSNYIATTIFDREGYELSAFEQSSMVALSRGLRHIALHPYDAAPVIVDLATSDRLELAAPRARGRAGVFGDAFLVVGFAEGPVMFWDRRHALPIAALDEMKDAELPRALRLAS